LLKYHFIPTRTAEEEAFNKLRTDRQNDRMTNPQHRQTRRQ